MKKNNFLILFITLLLSLYGCAGYKPIFSTNSLPFEISEYSVKGDRLIGNKIYSRLHNLSKSNKNENNIRSLNISIDCSKNKEATSKDTTGKILEFRLIVTANISVTDNLSSNQILNQTFNSSITYKIQDQHSETIKLENRSIESLISEIYEKLLLSLSEKIST